jgi:glycine/D-amino acid oxidase-like deaminating enzyme
VEVRTLHLDRQQVHQRLKQSAQAHGIITLDERVTGFEDRDRRILSVATAKGRSIRASWFVDASGAAASLLGREFKLSSVTYGPHKAALRAHFPARDWVSQKRLPTPSIICWMLAVSGSDEI